MEVSKLPNNTLLLKDGSVSIVFGWDLNNSKTEKQEQADIYVSSKVVDGSLNGVVIDSPGEYEIKGVYIQGLADEENGKENPTTYRVESNDLSILHFSPTSSKISKDLSTLLENVDIVVIDIDNVLSTTNLSEKEIHKLITKMSPKLLIPLSSSDKDKFLFDNSVGEIPVKKSKQLRKKDYLGSTLNIVKFA